MGSAARRIDTRPFDQHDCYRGEIVPTNPFTTSLFDDSMSILEAETIMGSASSHTSIEVEPILQRLVANLHGMARTGPAEDRWLETCTNLPAKS
jgi:hypothetical protein